MAVVALPALATALISRRHSEAASLADLELMALKPHTPASQHLYASLFRSTLTDFKAMTAEELQTWAVGLVKPLEEARREGDHSWEWVIVAEISAICHRFTQRDAPDVPRARRSAVLRTMTRENADLYV